MGGFGSKEEELEHAASILAVSADVYKEDREVDKAEMKVLQRTILKSFPQNNLGDTIIFFQKMNESIANVSDAFKFAIARIQIEYKRVYLSDYPDDDYLQDMLIDMAMIWAQARGVQKQYDSQFSRDIKRESAYMNKRFLQENVAEIEKGSQLLLQHNKAKNTLLQANNDPFTEEEETPQLPDSQPPMK